ncbi:MAG TPA: ester cyclase [Candidatus Sulfotelmatobacter sp.]|nr:ester cyclase [Candidatus Sulfotelmatobacter sp.]
MTTENKGFVRRMFELCLNQHDLDIYPQFYSECFVQHTTALGELRGLEHRHSLASEFAAFPDAHWNVEDQIAEGDKVVSRWSFVGTHRGTFMGIAPTEKQVIMSGICIDRIVDGKIVEEWEEWDTMGMMQALGVVPMETSVGDLVAP